MSISIANIRPANSQEWDAIWQECNYSTYFHSREWSEIWNVYTKGRMRPNPKLVTFSDDKKALLPLSSLKNYLAMTTDNYSSPAGTFGGWISTDDLNIEHAELQMNYLTTQIGNLVWRLNPYDELVMKLDVHCSKTDETHTINLESGFNKILKQWTKGHISAVHKAQREGVLVKLASTIDDWRAYYQVYKDSILRWGDRVSSVYDWELFHEMYQRKSHNIKLWLSINSQDIVVAGALCFYAKKHVVYWHGAALEEYFNLRPVNLLIYEAIKDACERGYFWFDFNPSGGHAGVEAFKKSFGAQPLPSPVIVIERPYIKIIRKIKTLVKKDLQ